MLLGAYIEIQDTGTALPRRQYVNFTGSVDCTDGSGKTTCNFTGGGAGEANTHSSVGGGLALTAATPKVGVDLRLVSMAAADFDSAADLITIDDTKWAKDSELTPDQVGSVTNTDVCQGDGSLVQCNIASLANLNTALGSSIADGPHTTDTNAGTICTGTTTYLDGEGTCDDLSTVYQPLESTLTDIADGTIAENLVNTANPWADDEVSDTLTASTSTTAAANDNDTSIATTAFVQQEIDDGDLLSDNCILENDATPIPDSCVGDGSDAGGGGPTILGGNVTCAVSASYCTIWTIASGGISASRGLHISGKLIIDTDSTTVAPQFRIRSADTGYTGNCYWRTPESTTLTTIFAVDNVPIAAAPADTAGTAFSTATPTPVWFDCALLSDASPGDIIVEWQLETGTSPTQTILRGSYYTLIQ